MPSGLLPQWLCGNSCTWAHEVRLHIAGTNKPKSAQQVKQGASYKWSYIYIYIYIYIYTYTIYIVFTNEGFLEIAVESWPEWDLNPRPLKS